MTTLDFAAVSRVDIREGLRSAAGVPFEYRLVPSTLALPLMRLMVSQVRRWRADGLIETTNHPLFDGLGGLCRKIKEGAASWRALDIIYNYQKQGSFVDRFWIRHMRNAQAVRNRKYIIVEQLRELCAAAIARKGKVRVLSLASGSAQAVFEALAEFPAQAVEVLLIDFDKAAGPYALQEAKRSGLAERVRFKQGNLLKFNRPIMLGNFTPDVIEMAGLLDYLEDDQAIELIKRIHGVLPEKGRFVTCHIHDNPERDFMTEVIEWGRAGGKQPPMLYRTRQELIELLRAGGFKTMTLFVEPHRIHSVAIADKT